MLTLYQGRTSVCSVKARLALAEKGVSFESQLLTLRGDQYEQAYLKLNPNAVVPTLVHDDRVVIESTVIMHYVDECFPGRARTLRQHARPLAEGAGNLAGGLGLVAKAAGGRVPCAARNVIYLSVRDDRNPRQGVDDERSR